jgi:hypothetical protein
MVAPAARPRCQRRRRSDRYPGQTRLKHRLTPLPRCLISDTTLVRESGQGCATPVRLLVGRCGVPHCRLTSDRGSLVMTFVNGEGDLDGAIGLARAVVDDLFDSGGSIWSALATTALVGSLVRRGSDADLQDARAAIDRLAAVPHRPRIRAARDFAVAAAGAAGSCARRRGNLSRLSGPLPINGDIPWLRRAYRDGRGDDLTGVRPHARRKPDRPLSSDSLFYRHEHLLQRQAPRKQALARGDAPGAGNYMAAVGESQLAATGENNWPSLGRTN